MFYINNIKNYNETIFDKYLLHTETNCNFPGERTNVPVYSDVKSSVHDGMLDIFRHGSLCTSKI